MLRVKPVPSPLGREQWAPLTQASSSKLGQPPWASSLELQRPPTSLEVELELQVELRVRLLLEW